MIASHHPDRLRRPAPAPGSVEHERFQQALAWNVFRTLELLTPAFWLRRLHARVLAEPFDAAPQMARISLWQRLPLPPLQRLDGSRPDVLADVVIETEHAVWTLLVPAARDPWSGDEDRVAQVVDAGAWLAGARDHHSGVIEFATSSSSFGGVLKRRYSRSRDSAELRSAARGPARPAWTRFAAVRWTDLAAILRECGDADSLPGIERALARNASAWLDRAGIDPAV